MSKSVYFYANDGDIQLIYETLLKHHAYIYSNSYDAVNQLPNFLDGPKSFYITTNNNNNSSISHTSILYIEYVPCFYLMGNLQCGSFYINDQSEKDDDLNIIFKLIKKYIKDNYLISTDKMFYVGPGIYLDWMNKKYRFATLLFYQEALINASNIRVLINNLLKDGYIIETNHKKIIDLCSDQYDLGDFVVFINPNDVSSTIVKRKFIRYETDSECIFVYKRKNMYSCRMDNRILYNGKSELIDLFNSIKEMSSM